MKMKTLRKLKVGFLALLALPINSAFASFKDGQRAYQRKDYAEAARLFYSSLAVSQGQERAKSELALAESLKNLGLNYSAAYFYARIVAQGSGNDFFRTAFESLGNLNAETPLGRASVAGLFDRKIDPLTVPPAARGFYFYFRGIEFFDRKNNNAAKAEFERVPSGNPYYPKAQYYLGVISTISKDLDGALNAFNRAARSATTDSLKELSILNIGRVYYERKDYKRAFSYYAQIPRNSDLWLQTIFEGAWAFFMIQRHNNTLGNIHTLHSPFFVNRFFPETYILDAITYLRLCRYNSVRDELKKFQSRYKPTFADLNNLLKKYQNQGPAFFGVVSRYKAQGSIREYQAASEILDTLSRSDAFKESDLIITNLDREKPVFNRYSGKWELSGLAEVLRNSFEARKSVILQSAGSDLYGQAIAMFRYLRDLSDQTRLINLEMLSGRTDELRNKLASQSSPSDSTVWGEGMKPLDLKQEIEYWPFEGEYWEDELGGYVYNVDSRCGTRSNGK